MPAGKAAIKKKYVVLMSSVSVATIGDFCKQCKSSGDFKDSSLVYR